MDSKSVCESIILNFKESIKPDYMSAICKKMLSCDCKDTVDSTLKAVADIDKVAYKHRYYSAMMRVAEQATLSWFYHPDSYEDIASYVQGILFDLEENFFNTTLPQEGNWWTYEIGMPRSLSTVLICLGDKIDVHLKERVLRAIYHHCPDCINRQADASKIETGCNKLWKIMNMILSGALNNDINRINEAVGSVASVFEYVTEDDGFYKDGSFIQHHALGYNGGYGQGLLNTLAKTLMILSGTVYEETVKNSILNIEDIIRDNFLKFIAFGSVADSLRGRGISRKDSTEQSSFMAGRSILINSAIIGLSIHNDNILKMVSQKLREAGITEDKNEITDRVIKECLAYEGVFDTSYSKVCYNMDKSFHRRDDYMVSVSLSSERIAKFEAINDENQSGWFQGDGAVYLYGKFPLKYSGEYINSINPYYYPGTTVCDVIRVRENMPENLSSNKFAGGVTYKDLYGVSGMEVLPDIGHLHVYKSYFMFDNEIVCLGSNIESSYNIHTTCDNLLSDRIIVREKNKAVVENECTYVMLDNHEFNYFVNGTGSQYTAITINHCNNDTYAYVMCPYNNESEIVDKILVLENSEKAHAVIHKELSLTGINVWSEFAYKGFVFSLPCSVIIKDNTDTFDVAISNPTHTLDEYTFWYCGTEYRTLFNEKGASATITIKKEE